MTELHALECRQVPTKRRGTLAMFSIWRWFVLACRLLLASINESSRNGARDSLNSSMKVIVS